MHQRQLYASVSAVILPFHAATQVNYCRFDDETWSTSTTHSHTLRLLSKNWINVKLPLFHSFVFGAHFDLPYELMQPTISIVAVSRCRWTRFFFRLKFSCVANAIELPNVCERRVRARTVSPFSNCVFIAAFTSNCLRSGTHSEEKTPNETSLNETF